MWQRWLRSHLKLPFLMAFFLLSGLTSNPNWLSGQDVQARLSARETYVGAEVILSVQVQGGRSCEMSELPSVRDCDIASLGPPQQASQITIFNGVRQESRSWQFNFRVRPTVAGEFTIPELEVIVDGVRQKTSALTFVARISETGDLLYAEISGPETPTYVGQEVELTLVFGVRPYADAAGEFKLNEGQMWQLLSQESRWGPFQTTIQELQDTNRRPAGKSLLRTLPNGRTEEYYEYRLSTRVRPRLPGTWNINDVEIVWQYPVAVGPARDPLSEMLGDAVGGGGGRPSLLNDDFFRSAFESRLVVSQVRPIRIQPEPWTKEIAPLPTANRPADFSGAVGEFLIAAEASPTVVAAGDPITLTLTLTGNSDLSSISAPRLSAVPELAADFTWADRDLPGQVANQVKTFVTTVRPNRSGITQIPPLPFSFFNPNTGVYQTVYTEPIPLQVSAAENLNLDALTGSSAPSAGAVAPQTNSALESGEDSGNSRGSRVADFRPRPEVLATRPAPPLAALHSRAALGWPRWSIVVCAIAAALGLLWPILVWLAARVNWAQVGRTRRVRNQLAPRAVQHLQTQVLESPSAGAAYQLFETWLRQCQPGISPADWIGRIRQAGNYDLAARWEELADTYRHGKNLEESAVTPQIQAHQRSALSPNSTPDHRRELAEFIGALARFWPELNKFESKHRNHLAARNTVNQNQSPLAGATPEPPSRSFVGVLLVLSSLAANCQASFVAPLLKPGVVEQTESTVQSTTPEMLVTPELSATLEIEIWREAEEVHRQAYFAEQAPETADRARALWQLALNKYQQVADAVPESPRLLVQLGQCHHALQEWGWSRWYWERARQLDPWYWPAQQSLSLWHRTAAPFTAATPLQPGLVLDGNRLWDLWIWVCASLPASAWCGLLLIAAALGGRDLWRARRGVPSPRQPVGRSRFFWSVAWLLGAAAVLGPWLQVWLAPSAITLAASPLHLKPGGSAHVSSPPESIDSNARSSQVLPAGTGLEWLQSQGEWVEVETPSGARGWLPHSRVGLIRQPAAPTLPRSTTIRGR